MPFLVLKVTENSSWLFRVFPEERETNKTDLPYIRGQILETWVPGIVKSEACEEIEHILNWNEPKQTENQLGKV